MRSCLLVEAKICSLYDAVLLFLSKSGGDVISILPDNAATNVGAADFLDLDLDGTGLYITITKCDMRVEDVFEIDRIETSYITRPFVALLQMCRR